MSFALTWDFPQVTMNNNQTIWMRRYTEFYGARMTGPADAAPGGYNTYIPVSYPFHQSRQIATDALASADQTLQAVRSWWAPLAGDQKVPAILRTAALNQLGQVSFKTSMWAAGFVSSTESPTLGHRLGTNTAGTSVYVAPDSINGGNLSMAGRRRVRVPRLQPLLPVDRARPAACHGRGDHARPQRGPDRSDRQR